MRRIVWATFRVIVAGAVAAAIVAQLMASIDAAVAHGRSVGPVVLRFFSFFTIDSNSLTVITLLIGAALLLSASGDDPKWFATLRVCLTTYMVTTGIVYNLLLRNVELPQGSTLIPWSNEILHTIAPIFIVLDSLFAPGRIPLPFRKTVRTVTIFPIAWVAYTLIRGPFIPDEITGKPYWYPYPFLDPHNSPNGYLSVSFYVILIAATIGLIAAATVWASRRTLTRVLPR